jgi:hypothetical protein
MTDQRITVELTFKCIHRAQLFRIDAVIDRLAKIESRHLEFV